MYILHILLYHPFLNNINLDPLRLGHEFERARNFGFSLGCSEFPEAPAEKNQAEMIETLR